MLHVENNEFHARSGQHGANARREKLQNHLAEYHVTDLQSLAEVGHGLRALHWALNEDRYFSSFCLNPCRSSTSRLTTFSGTSPRQIARAPSQSVRPMSRNSSEVQATECDVRITLSRPVKG